MADVLDVDEGVSVSSSSLERMATAMEEKRNQQTHGHGAQPGKAGELPTEHGQRGRHDWVIGGQGPG
eukprot:9262069-Pyramimonas_sp.AAC.1